VSTTGSTPGIWWTGRRPTSSGATSTTMTGRRYTRWPDLRIVGDEGHPSLPRGSSSAAATWTTFSPSPTCSPATRGGRAGSSRWLRP
jgi:hypothetical protein